MPRFAANISTMFPEFDFLDRIDHAAEAGFTAIECQTPYIVPAADIVVRLRAHKLAMVLHNLPAGNLDAGERGIAVMPDRVAEFRASVAEAIKYAKTTACDRVNCLAGISPKGVSPQVVHDTFVGNLHYAAAVLKAEGIKLLIEPINTVDVPGFYLNRTEQAADIIAEVGSDNLFIQYDIYHAQIMEGDLARTFDRFRSRIAHVQFADNPGRHEPGTGEINFPFLFRHLDVQGYDGWIGAEYKPARTTLEGLSWFAPFRASR